MIRRRGFFPRMVGRFRCPGCTRGTVTLTGRSRPGARDGTYREYRCEVCPMKGWSKDPRLAAAASNVVG